MVDIFTVDEQPVHAAVTSAVRPSASTVRKTTKAATRNYLSDGNAAIAKDWAEF